MTDNPRQDLEREAREAAHEHSCSLLRMGLRPAAATERGDHYELGYLTAATAREKEIEELREKVERWKSEADDKDTVPRSRYNACNQDWLDADKALERLRDVAKREIESRDAEIASLRAKLAAVPVEEIEFAATQLRYAGYLAESKTIDRWLAGLEK